MDNAVGFNNNLYNLTWLLNQGKSSNTVSNQLIKLSIYLIACIDSDDDCALKMKLFGCDDKIVKKRCAKSCNLCGGKSWNTHFVLVVIRFFL